jgi:aspartate/methionine/tyrosine aminotransferase
MYIEPFRTEQFFSLYEFNTPHLLSVSDCETISVAELLTMAGQSLGDLGSLSLGYTESQGHPELRAAIAKIYNEVSEDQVVVLTSPVEGIYLTMRTLLEPGDEAIVLVPAYDSLKNMAQHVCGTIHQWKLEPNDGCWQMDLDQLEALINERTKLIIVNLPHNPTGFLPSQAQFDQLIDIARKHDIWLFSDEMYRGLEFDGNSLPSVADRHGKSVVLSGLSKAYGLPGLRSGWLVIQDEVVRNQLINWKHYTTICPAAPTEHLAMVALQVGEELIQRNRELILENLEYAEPFFQKWTSFFEWRAPQAGSVAFVGIDAPSATEYCHTLAKEAGVLLLPSSCMWENDGFVRFGFGRKSFQSALDHYDEFLNGSFSK